jgi:hypothetical protein
MTLGSDAPGPSRYPRPRTRRTFLRDLGALALTAPVLGSVGGLVTGCGGPGPVAPTIVPLFSPDHVLVAGRTQRIPLAVVSPTGDASDSVALPDDDEEIEVTIRLDGELVDRVSVGGRVVEHDHVGENDPDHQHADLFRYYPLRADLPTPGIYDLTFEIGGTRAELPVQAFDPSEVDIPVPGDPFPAVSTPTIADPDGVDPLCTRFEPCGLHQHDAAELLAAGRPFALLVASPAYCSTAYCGPVLETLLQVTAGHSDIDAVHVEVYANPSEVGGNIADPGIRLAPAVEALGLGFEPSLFLVAGDGILADRIDNVFDRSELEDAIARLQG